MPSRKRDRAAGILSALQATEAVDTKPKLPAEILDSVLDHLPVADQMRVARASRRMREMVYDDSRWISRLRSMGCWDEREARRRIDESLRRRRDAAQKSAVATARPNGKAPEATLFDAAAEEQRRRRATSDLRDGFETMSLGRSETHPLAPEPALYLDALDRVRSIRGGARQEYGRVHQVLAPLYYDLVRAKSHAQPMVFTIFPDPERQARMLANLHKFSRADWATGCQFRHEKLSSMRDVFQLAAAREFEQGCELWDVDGRMRRYAHVLHALDGSGSAVEVFLEKQPLFQDGDLLAFLRQSLRGRAATDDNFPEPSRRFYEVLLVKVNEQADVTNRIFPEPAAVFWKLVDKVKDEMIGKHVASVLGQCHGRNTASHLSAVSGLLEQTMRFFQSLAPPPGSDEDLKEMARKLTFNVFEQYLPVYLEQELNHFTNFAEAEVMRWEKKLSEEDSTLESFYMSNINRSAEKKDFLSSFKKVIMMPVTVLPSFPMGTNSTATKSAAIPAVMTSSRPQTPASGGRASPLAGKAPTDELEAKAAIMASKLAGIKSLCSIEVALNLVHTAKRSLGRAAVVIRLGGQVGAEAREQCASIFVILLRILGQRHVKGGFDTAVGHLAHYSPREASDRDHCQDQSEDHELKGVAPLVTFIELVNVGDLISQMVDVFYEQQLVAPGIADRNDFLDPAGLAKKKFEQMLDESVAAGLNKGIDVLMDEVEFLQGTTQLATDYNPLPTDEAGSSQDIGPTTTARRIVDLLSSHTRMLVGTTDKAMLDVFNAEVGLRLFAAICKHLKRQRISTAGAVKLIADVNLYADFARRLRNQDLVAYFSALRELSQIYLVDPAHARDLAGVIADADRFGGVFRAEEVYEYAQRRADWYQVKKSVERAMYGMECAVL